VIVIIYHYFYKKSKTIEKFYDVVDVVEDSIVNSSNTDPTTTPNHTTPNPCIIKLNGADYDMCNYNL
jgi:hypothetical protein